MCLLTLPSVCCIILERTKGPVFDFTCSTDVSLRKACVPLTYRHKSRNRTFSKNRKHETVSWRVLCVAKAKLIPLC